MDVQAHDDNSFPSMYDLRVGPIQKPHLAIECVKDINTDAIRTWKKGPEKGPVQVDVNGSWVIGLFKHAQIKNVTSRLKAILAKIYQDNIPLVGAGGATEL